MPIIPAAAYTVFINETFYANYRGYVQKLMSSTDWDKSYLKTATTRQLLNSVVPARVRVRTLSDSYKYLERISRTSFAGYTSSSKGIELLSQASYDWSLGKLGDRWLGGPYHTYKVVKNSTPSPFYDHSKNPYNVPDFLGGGKFWWRSRYVLDVPPYTGDIKPTGKVTHIPADMIPLFQIADGYVQGARNSADPGTPTDDFGQAIAEIRDLPKLLQIAGNNLLAKLGGSYLNYSFGWKPFLKDLRALMNIAYILEKRVQFLKKNEGLIVHRRRPLFTYSGTPSSSRSLTFSGAVSYGTTAPVGGTYPITDDYKVSAWYVSNLKYRLLFDTTNWQQNKPFVAALMSLRPDFKLIWDICPWTWFIDYFSNIGDLVAGLFDERVTETTILDEWILIDAQIRSHCEVPVHFKEKAAIPPIPAGYASCETISYLKTRQVPSRQTLPVLRPLDLFTGNQIAIIMALAVSRMRYL